MQKKHADRGFTVVAVDARGDDVKALKKFAKDLNVNYPILVGGDRAAENWGVRGLPASFIIDRKGKVAKKWVGFREADAEKMNQAVEALLQ